MNSRAMALSAVLLAAVAVPSAARAQDEAKVPAPSANQDVDGVRFRGGFSLNGGIGILSSGGTLTGPVAGLAARLGVQFNHLLSVTYQNMPQLFFLSGPGGAAATFLDYNSLLLNLTLVDMFEIGAGPSFDYAAIASLTGAGVTTGSEAGFGIHGRFAFIIGGRYPGAARRSGFSIGLDAHPIFLGSGTLMMLTVGIGADWY